MKAVACHVSGALRGIWLGGRGEGTPELACHARQRALCLTQTVLIFTATRSSVSLSPLFTDGETRREKSGPCLRSRAPQRLRPGLLPLAPFAFSRGPSPCRCHDNGRPIGNRQRRPRPCPAPGGGLRTIRAPGRAAGAGSQEHQAPAECRVSTARRILKTRRARAAATMCGKCGARLPPRPRSSSPWRPQVPMPQLFGAWA